MKQSPGNLGDTLNHIKKFGHLYLFQLLYEPASLKQFHLPKLDPYFQTLFPFATTPPKLLAAIIGTNDNG